MNIDVSEVLDDPDFQDTFTVQRRTETVGTNGIASVTPSPFTAQGAVFPGDKEVLKRLSDEQHLGKALGIVTKTMIQGPTPGKQPDLIVWGGDSYVVVFVDDYSKYGSGFVYVGCSSIDALDRPPGSS